MKIGILQEDTLKGYVNDVFVCNIANNPEQIAAFICKYGLEGDLTITDGLDLAMITTMGPFVRDCYDQDYLLNVLMPILVPIQQGEKEIEFKTANMEEIVPVGKYISNVIISVGMGHALATVTYEEGYQEIYSKDSKTFRTEEELLKEFPNAIDRGIAEKIAKERNYI